MGSKGSSTQQTTSSSGPPAQVMGEYQALVDRATNVANQPYQPYQGELVAPLSSQTTSGLGGINQYSGTAQPYLGAAGAMTMGASGAVDPTQFGGMGSLAPFMNPYTQSVVGATQAEMNNQNQQQAQFLNSANISSGAFGGDRAGIGQSILANQQQLAEAPTIAGLNQANYNQALQAWQQQQGVNLSAAQADAARQMSGAAQLGQIGTTAQQAGLQGAQAQIQAGMIPQQEQQAIDTAAQNMYQTQQAYPFTTTGWLGNIVEGTGGLSGGTSQTTSPAPNTLTQGIGAATQGLGLLGSLFSLSDVRAKENVEPIGQTYDGQKIYRYNFKGDPRTQIGLLAQEEAYHDPGSVQRIGMGDLLGVDYEGATDEAAERGHFAYGGAPMSSAQMLGAMGGMGGMSGMGGMGGGGYTPATELMMMGDPGARMGLGSMALASGADVHPDPGFGTGPTFGGSSGRPGFQSGGSSESFGSWSPGQQVNPLAGVSEAEWNIGSGGKYMGMDLGQLEAIGGGQWLPPQTNTALPNYQDLGSTPQFGSAEASLAGMFGGGYTPGQVPGGSTSATPAAQPQQATPTSSGTLGQAVLQSLGMGNLTSDPQKAEVLAQMVLGGAPTSIVDQPFSTGGSGGGSSTANAIATGGSRATGGGVGGGADMGRMNFQDGGFYTPSTGDARHATQHQAPVPPAIAVQRQLQGRARAAAAVKHGLVRPRVIAPDPVTGQHHDITPPHTPTPATGYPLHDRAPFGAGPYNAGGGGPLDPNPFPGPPVRFGAKIPFDQPPGAPEDLPGARPPQQPGETVGPTGQRTYPMPEGESLGEFAGALPGRLLRGTTFGRGAGIAGQILSPSPAETGELPPAFWPKQVTGPAPTRNGNTVDLGTWGTEGGAPGPYTPEPTEPDPNDISRWQDEGGRRSGGAVHPAIAMARRMRQGGGGVMGSSPIMNAGGYTPQGFGMTGTNSQGQGLGSFATTKAASGFGDLFGPSGRAGFAEGGDIDPFLAAIERSVPSGGGGGGRGPPPPPNPPSQGGGGGGGQPQDLSKNLGQLGSAVKGALGGGQQPAAAADLGLNDVDSNYGLDGGGGFAPSTLPDSMAGDAAMAMQDWGFATGGGVGLGSLRGSFQQGGASDAEAEALDQAIATDAAPAPAQAQVAPQGVSGGGSLHDMIGQSFGDRADYAATIAGRESNSGRAYVGDDESSFGPFQLHYGGISKQYPHAGLGDEFTQQTGLDARDPKTVPEQVKFVADYTAKHGWKDWSTAKADNPGPASGGAADVPSEEAQPAQATTESYGGGFQLPGQGQQQQMPTLGSELRRDPWGYLMTVGAGMMASRSPWLGVGLGEGFEAGNKYLAQMQGLEKDWGVAQANINNMNAEAREHGADADLKSVQLDIARQMAQIRIQIMRQLAGTTDGSTSPTAAPGTIAGGVGTLGPLGGGAQPSAAPSPGAGPSGGGGGGAPQPSAGAAPSGAPAPSAAATAPAPVVGDEQLSSDPDWVRGQQLIAAGKQRNALGEAAGFKGIGDAQIAQGEALVQGAQSRFAPVQKGREEEQSQGRKDMLENDTAEGEAAAVRSDMRNKLTQLQAINDDPRFQTGAWAPTQAEISSWGQYFGVDPRNATNAQEFEKLAYNEMYKELSQAGLKGQIRNMEIQGFMRQMPELGKTPQANRDIINNALSLIDRGDAYGNAYSNWRQGEGKHALNEGLFKRQWNTENPAEGFLNKRNTGYAQSHARPDGVPPTAQLGTNKKGQPVWRDPQTKKMFDWQGNPLN